MEEIAESIGRLSTDAKEWKPGTIYSSPTTSNRQNNTNPSITSTSYKGAFKPALPGLHVKQPQSQQTQNWLAANEFNPSFSSSRPWQQSLSNLSPNTTSTNKNNANINNTPPKTNEWQTNDTSTDHMSSTWNKNMSIQNTNANNVNNATTVPSPPITAGSNFFTSSNNPKNIHSLGLSEAQWSFYRALAVEALREMEPTDPRHKAVPTSFSHAYPLDLDTLTHSSSHNAHNKNTKASSSFGYPSSVFKVMSRDDGHLYCLRRLDNVKCVSRKIAATVTERWLNASTATNSNSNNNNNNSNHNNNNNVGRPLLHHPGICRFYQCFVSQRAVFFIHDYHPGAITLSEQFLDPHPTTAGPHSNMPLQEQLIWSFVTQLVSALRAIHKSNLACRSLQSNHILCTSDQGQRFRLRINCVAVIDALEYESRKPLAALQNEDMRCLGRIILSLATRTNITRNTDNDTLNRCQQYMAQNYSDQLHSLVMALLFQNNLTAHNKNNFNNKYHPTSTINTLGTRSLMIQPPTITNTSSMTPSPNIFEVSSMIAQHVYDELDDVHILLDQTSNGLAQEYESGRALRLLLKLGFVNERPEFGMDTRWSETGDCYVLKLFRDYVFHQADVNGQPMMDLGHVITSLNKLDVADPERITLVSRDGKSLLVVSFADVSRCLEGAYNELCSQSNAATEGRPAGSLAYG